MRKLCDKKINPRRIKNKNIFSCDGNLVNNFKDDNVNNRQFEKI